MVRRHERTFSRRHGLCAAVFFQFLTGAALACTPDVQIGNNADILDLSQGFYKEDSLWSALTAPEVEQKPRRESEEDDGFLVVVPCPDESWTRTPDVDLNYEPATGPIDLALLFQRRNLRDLIETSQVMRVGPLSPLQAPVQVALPQVARDVPALPGPVPPDAAPVLSNVAPKAPVAPEAGRDTPAHRTAVFEPPISLRIPPAQREAPAAETTDTPAVADLAVPAAPKGQAPVVVETVELAQPAPVAPSPVATPLSVAKAVLKNAPDAPKIALPEDDLAAALASADATVSAAKAMLKADEALGQLPEFGGRMRLMTGDNFRPFNDRNLMKGGLITEVLGTAIATVVERENIEIVWVEDWAAQIDPMLSAQDVEIAFPVPKPDCASASNSEICDNYLFSEPIFEYFVQLFVDARKPVRFTQDSDLEGLRVCRPAGLPNHMLDEAGREWVSADKITLEQPPLVTDCFFMLVQGEVDGVIMNRFTAQETILAMGLAKRVTAIAEHPISISGLHAVVRKDNPQAEALMDVVNNGLSQIRADGRFGEIVSRHLQDIWDRI